MPKDIARIKKVLRFAFLHTVRLISGSLLGYGVRFIEYHCEQMMGVSGRMKMGVLGSYGAYGNFRIYLSST